MSMDPLFIEAVVGELREKILGAAVSKIHQPGPHELVLRLWTGRENLRLLISADPRASRLHLTAASLPNPAAPPRFCQLLRARLCRLLEIERLPGERIVRLLFSGKDEQRWTLVAELLGTRANLLLLDGEGRIVDALQRREEEGRAVGPGLSYAPPALPPRFDLAAGVPDIPADVPLRPWLLESVAPMTPLVAEDLAAAVAAGLRPQEALARFRARWLLRDFVPLLGSWRKQPVLAPYFPEFLDLEEVRRFDTPSGAADAFYADQTGRELFCGGGVGLERIVHKGLARLRKRLGHIEAEGERARGSERQRELGDLLLANLGRLRRGMTEVVLEDWYADPPAPVTIPLDPALSPQENAEGYFRRHRKGRRALEHVERRRAETFDEIDWLEGVALALEEAAEPAEQEAIRQELAAAGMLRARPEPGRGGRPSEPRDQLRRAVTPGGYQLFWGKSNRGNDHVSRHLAGADDLWFHAHNLPGCHLLLKRGEMKGEIPEADVLFAAAIAAGYSRGKDAGKVEVMVALGRWVKKPKGARPGAVTVEHYRTVLVRPQRLEGGECRSLPA
jgi:predicted ribosome quality control (RQC) complex YloA/Tae2 family protein